MTADIIPGTTFLDTSGRIAQLHGVGIQQIDGRYFAWGEDKTRGSQFTAVSCYSSTDLATWDYEGAALTAGAGELSAEHIVERPKVLAHPDGRFVMFLHIDSPDYSDARVGYAVADTPAGPYEYCFSERPLGNVSRDIGIYQEDGIGYLLSEDRENGLHLYRLRDDYLGVQSIVSTTLKNDGSHGYESPALIKHDGLYYLFGSDLTGWSHNDNQYATATRLEGPWSAWADLAPPGTATFDSQVSTVLTVQTSAVDRFVYVGDRWQRHELATSPAVWLPLELKKGTASLHWRERWSLTDLAT
jgi:hypothetical protein